MVVACVALSAMRLMVKGERGIVLSAGWWYDVNSPSSDGTFPRAIYILNDSASFGSANPGGNAMCGIALSSYSAAGQAKLSGTSTSGKPVTVVTVNIPAYPDSSYVVLDSTWQGIMSLTVATNGLKGISLWAVYYYS